MRLARVWNRASLWGSLGACRVKCSDLIHANVLVRRKEGCAGLVGWVRDYR